MFSLVFYDENYSQAYTQVFTLNAVCTHCDLFLGMWQIAEFCNRHPPKRDQNNTNAGAGRHRTSGAWRSVS